MYEFLKGYRCFTIADMPAKLQGWALIAGHLLAITILLLPVRETFNFAWQSYQFGARSYVANLLEWPWMMIIPFSLATLAVAIFARMLGDLDRTLKGLPMRETANGAEGEEL